MVIANNSRMAITLYLALIPLNTYRIRIKMDSIKMDSSLFSKVTLTFLKTNTLVLAPIREDFNPSQNSIRTIRRNMETIVALVYPSERKNHDSLTCSASK